MNLFGKYKLFIFIALGCVVALVAWWGFSGDNASESLLTTQNVADSTQGDKALIDTLLQLRAVSLSGTIFSDPAFMNLRDFGTQIIPEPVGRPNPFAPIVTTSSRAAPDGAASAPR